MEKVGAAPEGLAKKKKKPKKKKGDGKKPEAQPLHKQEAKKLRRWLYLEEGGLFPTNSKVLKVEGSEVVQLKGVVRATGYLTGTLVGLEPDGRSGELQVDGHSFAFYDMRPPKIRERFPLQDAVGQELSWSHWPTFPHSEDPQEVPRLERLQISRCGERKEEPENLIEIVGCLEQLWEDFFVLKFWSLGRRKFFFVYVFGAYPYPDELGEWVRVIARLNAEKGYLELVEAEALAFLSEEEKTQFKLR